ncbi:Nucleotidyl transferase AbiEii toxin, Type IV TA system [Filimonas lacunae]|uniref:Nucleotidyl transferase AbiEii toxin, Type IV TA system n=1 Tax=Filimonas lacunae TaxID=477680 RepID=A0A173MQF5_9BACT|nr:nucleotidyl transferase AbiEii/AbiGii toxin family protein [Filimonas lacunae]BAV09679.1 hypothetical protein FLA_5732 [Filimonas lacunae]SIS77126.1 Nucleotidyl transferase AbiEii toxin, Type IV TA system [Filimonas lacunae]
MYWNTVDPKLQTVLLQLMEESLFDSFRLVGGTALSLQLGHRMSIDIDLFTDALYGSIDFKVIDTYLRHHFAHVSPPWDNQPIGMGRGYVVGESVAREDLIKMDLYYTDQFIRPFMMAGNVRMATIEEIAAMKIDVVQREGRKKDFWDIHEMLTVLTLEQMIALHEERYPFNHDINTIHTNLSDFSNAEDDLDPICLRGKHWEFIKLELATAVEELKR